MSSISWLSVFNVISCHFRIQCPILSGFQKSYNIYYMIHSVSPSSTSFHALLDAVKSKHSKAKVICVASKWWVNLTYIPMRDMPFWNPIISKPFWQHEISWIPLCLSCYLSGHMRCQNGTKTHFQKLCMERLLIWRWRAKGRCFAKATLRFDDHRHAYKQSAMAIARTELRFVGTPTSITFQHLARHGPLKTMAWSKQRLLPCLLQDC